MGSNYTNPVNLGNPVEYSITGKFPNTYVELLLDCYLTDRSPSSVRRFTSPNEAYGRVNESVHFSAT